MSNQQRGVSFVFYQGLSWRFLVGVHLHDNSWVGARDLITLSGPDSFGVVTDGLGPG